MANPLFESLNGGPVQNNQNGRNMDPLNVARQAGFNIPEGTPDNSQAIVMHLIQTGQVSNPLLQRIAPMINNMMGR